MEDVAVRQQTQRVVFGAAAQERFRGMRELRQQRVDVLQRVIRVPSIRLDVMAIRHELVRGLSIQIRRPIPGPRRARCIAVVGWRVQVPRRTVQHRTHAAARHRAGAVLAGDGRQKLDGTVLDRDAVRPGHVVGRVGVLRHRMVGGIPQGSLRRIGSGGYTSKLALEVADERLIRFLRGSPEGDTAKSQCVLCHEKQGYAFPGRIVRGQFTFCRTCRSTRWLGFYVSSTQGIMDFSCMECLFGMVSVLRSLGGLPL